jgi:hypothetical protein
LIKLWFKVISWHNTYRDWDCQKMKWIQLKSNFDYFIFHVDNCRRNLDISCPTPPTPISIVWSARSFPPSLLCFDSALNVDLTQFKTNLLVVFRWSLPSSPFLSIPRFGPNSSNLQYTDLFPPTDIGSKQGGHRQLHPDCECKTSPTPKSNSVHQARFVKVNFKLKVY